MNLSLKKRRSRYDKLIIHLNWARPTDSQDLHSVSKCQSHLLLRAYVRWANVRWHDNDIRRRQRTITVQCALRIDGFTYGEVPEGGRLRRFGVGLQISLAFGEGCAVRNQNGESLIFGLHGDG